jgi:hypothetical protein
MTGLGIIRWTNKTTGWQWSAVAGNLHHSISQCRDCGHSYSTMAAAYTQSLQSASACIDAEKGMGLPLMTLTNVQFQSHKWIVNQDNNQRAKTWPLHERKEVNGDLFLKPGDPLLNRNHNQKIPAIWIKGWWCQVNPLFDCGDLFWSRRWTHW